jgi:rubrerythrin
MDWLNFLKMMIIEEQAARDKYALAAQLSDSPELKAAFQRLRDEETFHAEVLEAQYTKLERMLPHRYK